MSGAPLTNKGSTTRLKVLVEARKMLINKGYGNVVMREVAETCGMKLGNLQYYFPTHTALIKAIIVEETRQDLDLADSALQSSEDPRVQLKSVVKALLTRWQGDTAIVFSTLYYLVSHDDTFREIYKEVYDRYYCLLEGVIKQVSPGNSKQEYATRARLLCSLIDGAPYQTHVGRRAAFLGRVEDQAYRIAVSDD